MITVYQYYRCTTKWDTSVETSVFILFVFYYWKCNQKFTTSASEPWQLHSRLFYDKSRQWFNILLRFVKYCRIYKKRPKVEFLFLKMYPNKILCPGTSTSMSSHLVWHWTQLGPVAKSATQGPPASNRPCKNFLLHIQSSFHVIEFLCQIFVEYTHCFIELVTKLLATAFVAQLE